ncbi:MAG: acyltransferase family protein [Bacteroidales bacterium]|nr:acyltransferase family protein [Bacteroidales bacterium]MCM1416100.1 acyltransferase family protein [bacterium]MCM1422832.1 acyltransferase family protein [bacterium]
MYGQLTQADRQPNASYNVTFGVLSAFAILMIVAGHAGYEIFTVGGLFPYYSFHVPLFLVISGYFYREEEEESPFLYCKKKVKRLLLPYFVWNLVYGVIAWALRTFCGFYFGESISPKTLFVSPFLHGYQYIYNFAAWFVPVLFVIEMMNLCMRLILRKLRLYDERLILACCLAAGVCVVQLAIGGHVWGLYKMPGRILFLYPCFQMGQFYRKKLEAKDTLGNLPYFAIVLTVQVFLHLCCNGLAYSSVWCTGFANGPLIPYVTAVSGTAFWLRVARVLAPLCGGKAGEATILYLGRNTYAVMMHHIMAFMLVKMALAGIAAHTGYLADFDAVRFRADIDYYYLVKGSEAFQMVYLAAGVVLPLLLQRGLDALLPAVRRHLPAPGQGRLFGR